jgi:DNA repair exonuclease SbcCD ATPase subunit
MDYIKLNIKRDVKKIIHLADIHIRQYKRYEEYEEVFKEMHNEVKKHYDENTLIAVLGDVVHSKNELSPELVELTAYFLKSLSDIGPTILVAGNHDANLNNKNRIDSLTPIVNLISNDNLFYLRSSGLYTVGNLCFSVMSVFDEMTHYIKAKDIDDKYVKIACYHGPLNGVKNDSNYTLSGKMTNMFFTGYDSVLLGDIHNRQIVSKKPLIVYPGSLLCQNYGEHPTDHGFAVHDIDTMTCTFVDVKNDYSYYTIDVDDSLVIPKVNIQSKHPRIRVRFKDVKLELIAGTLDVIKRTYHPSELIYVKNNTVANNSVFSKNQISDISNIKNVEVQNKFIQRFLDKKYKLSKDIVQGILDVNQETNANVKLETFFNTSMWNLLEFRWSNMFSFGEDNYINFTDMNGVYGLFGANATGKSSFSESLAFALFDKTSKESKMINLLNVRKQSFKCSITLEHCGKKYLIRRVGTKNKKGTALKYEIDFFEYEGDKLVSLNGEDKWGTNRNIRYIIGDLDDFLLSSYSVQNDNLGFVNKSNSERKDILLKFLGLKIFDLLFDIANVKLKEYNVLLRDIDIDAILDDKLKLEKQISIIQNDIDKANESSINVQQQIIDTKDNILNTHKTLIQINENENVIDTMQITNDLEASKSKLSSLEIQLKDNEIKILKYKEAYDIAQDALVDKDIIIKKYQEYLIDESQYKSLKKQLDINKIDLDKLEKEVATVHELEYDPNCEFCQKNFGYHFDSVTSNYKSRKERYNDMQNECNDAYTRMISHDNIVDQYGTVNSIIDKVPRITKEISLLNDSIAATKAAIIKHEKQIIDWTNTLSESKAIAAAQLNNKNANDKIKILENRLKDEESRLNVLKTKVMDSLMKMNQVSSKIDDYSKDIDKHANMAFNKECQSMYCDIVKRDGIPYEIILDILPQVEVEVNNILSQIVDFSLLILPDENKNINIYIVYDTERYWNLDLGSGMEKFISSLALRIALTNLSNLPRPNFLIIDEGWGNLDSENIGSIQRLFDYLRSKYKFILVISHIDSIKDSVDSIIDIKLKDTFSKIEYGNTSTTIT